VVEAPPPNHKNQAMRITNACICLLLHFAGRGSLSIALAIALLIR
jgi:hypothetical protein